MKAPCAGVERRPSAMVVSDPRALVLWTILSLGQTQIEQGKIADIDDVFTEFNKLDRQERNR